ncbi:hypothetical protein K1719_002414 [Acacia pycnantha]|nr:hypothetical protein K1719_002414 [Acacia pycnantha]
MTWVLLEILSRTHAGVLKVKEESKLVQTLASTFKNVPQICSTVPPPSSEVVSLSSSLRFPGALWWATMAWVRRHRAKAVRLDGEGEGSRSRHHPCLA